MTFAPSPSCHGYAGDTPDVAAHQPIVEAHDRSWRHSCNDGDPAPLTRARLAELIAAFIAGGGHITVCPPDGSGLLPHHDDTHFLKVSALRRAGARSGQRKSLAAAAEAKRKLSFEHRRALRAEFQNGQCTDKRELARRYGVSLSTVRATLKEATP